MRTINLIAPAKVNLFLGIGNRLEDGYHSATTVMHALSMHDRLTMTQVSCGEHVIVVEPNDPAQPEREAEVAVQPGDGLRVVVRNLWTCGIAPLDIPSESNLAYRAIFALAKMLDRKEDETIRVVIEKNIPYQAGLGGGSSDAAAALVGAAQLWGVDPESPALKEAAREIGADVRFFMHGGCALLEGKGDKLVRFLDPRRDSVAVIRPSKGVSTAAAYRLFDEAPELFEEATLEAVRAARTAAEVPLGNNLQKPAFALLPDVELARELALSTPGVTNAQVCGSGSAVFAVCESFPVAQALVAQAQRQGFWARATSFSGIRAAVLPSAR